MNRKRNRNGAASGRGMFGDAKTMIAGELLKGACFESRFIPPDGK